eukprot:gene26415-44838_t
MIKFRGLPCLATELRRTPVHLKKRRTVLIVTKLPEVAKACNHSIVIGDAPDIPQGGAIHWEGAFAASAGAQSVSVASKAESSQLLAKHKSCAVLRRRQQSTASDGPVDPGAQRAAAPPDTLRSAHSSASDGDDVQVLSAGPGADGWYTTELEPIGDACGPTLNATTES